MKTLKQFFGLASIVASFVLASCTVDSIVENYTKDVASEISIQYSTGGAKWDATNPQTLELNKIGVGTTGTVPYLIVTSNNYWTIEIPEEYQDWLSASPLGGPAPAQTTTNVYLTLQPNELEEEREGELYFVTRRGERYRVPIRQYANVSKLIYVKDNFGEGREGTAEDIQVKFYQFPPAEGVAVAGDTYAYGYVASDNTYVSIEEPSQNYADVVDGVEASGGANIAFDGKGYFTVRNFNNQNNTSFRLTFGAKNSDGRFNKRDLKLEISHNALNWANMDYNHEESLVNDWTLNTINFEIAPNVSKILYFRFTNNSNDLYRIDDFKVIEKEPNEEDPFFELIVKGSDVIGLPVTFKYNNLNASNRNGEYWINYGTVFSDQSGFYEEGAPDDINMDTNAFVQFVTGSDISRVKERTDGFLVTSNSPKVTGQWENDAWIWTLPVHNASAMTNLRCELTFMGTDAGVKYHYFEYAQCNKEDYALLGRNLLVMDDKDKNAFYNTLDWKILDEVEVTIPNDEDKQKNSSGIPVGSASSPSGYVKDVTFSYSDGFKGGSGSKQIVVNKIVTFTEPVVDGYYFLRLRAAYNLTCGPCNSTNFQRINKSDHNGTNYLRQTATFSFDSCGKPATPGVTFRMLSLFSNIAGSMGYDGADVMFSDKAAMGVFVGNETNVQANSVSDNYFTGDIVNAPTGQTVYTYSPYVEENDAATKEDILVAVPSEQIIDNGRLIADSAPFVISNKPTYKTTSSMRCEMNLVSSILKLGIYTSKPLADRISAVEIISDNNIAGTYSFNLVNGTLGEPRNLTKSLRATALKAFAAPESQYEAANVYLGVWPGEHTLTVKVTSGGYVYTKEYSESLLCEAVKVSSLLFDMSDPTVSKQVVSGEDIPVGITDAAMFRQFCQDLVNGLSGESMMKYRNSDGDYGFGSADKNAEKVIDMAGVDMSGWPMAILPEDFNGSEYRIKNLVIDGVETALFANVAYGATVSNIIFDESCKLTVSSAGRASFLCLGGTVSNDSSAHIASGSFKNIVNYGTIEIKGNIDAALYVGPVFARASAARTDYDVNTPSVVVGCKNYGKFVLKNITQNTASTKIHLVYHTIGGVVGSACGYEISECENYGDFFFDSINRKLGSFDVGGVAGYITNHNDDTISPIFGHLVNSFNYGNFYVGYSDATTKTSCLTYSIRLGGLVGRTQWTNLDRLENNGNFLLNVELYDPCTKEWSQDWNTVITQTTNTPGGCMVGGILSFSQCNIARGVEHNYLDNHGSIKGEVNMRGKITDADNVGVCIGGVMAIFGANAYNPHFNNCSNDGDIVINSNECSAWVSLGGIMGRMASNRNHVTDGHYYTLNGNANIGRVEFATETADVIAHVGGVCGSMTYGQMRANVSGGAIVNKSTNPESATAAILALQRKSSIGPSSGTTALLEITGAQPGGSVNGVKVTEQNYTNYVLGRSTNLSVADGSIVISDSSFFNWE